MTVIVERSSSHPVRYAIMLAVWRRGVWQTIRAFANAHAPDEHHEHAYVGLSKCPPVISYGPVNEAMHAAEVKLRASWRDIVIEWERP